MAENATRRTKGVVEWKLEADVEHTRQAIIHRARSLSDRLTRLADGLEADPEYSFNTIGELQGNGVELDTWCAKLGFGRDLLRLLRQALAHEAEDLDRNRTQEERFERGEEVETDTWGPSEWRAYREATGTTAEPGDPDFIEAKA